MNLVDLNDYITRTKRMIEAALAEPEEIPTQEYEIGERVRCAHFYGTVVEYVPQVYADNLYRVAWDTDSDDTDLYTAGSLASAHGIGGVA